MGPAAVDEALDPAPRPQAVIHAVLVGLEAAPDARTLSALAGMLETLSAATDLAARRWSDAFGTSPGQARLLHCAEAPLPASVLALAQRHRVEPAYVARAFNELLDDCDCQIVMSLTPAAPESADPPLRDALALDRPIILARPRTDEGPLLVTLLRDEFGLDAPGSIATRREPLSPEGLAEEVLAPPRHSERAHLAGFLEEGPWRSSRRFEYDLLMRLLSPPPRRQRAPAPEPWASAGALAGEGARWPALLRRHYEVADGHALFYGRRWRSALVTRSLLLLISTVVLGLIGMRNQDFGIVTIPLQAVIAGHIFLDSWRAKRGQWQRRWLEYRLLAERLRCLRFLRLAGVADAEDAMRPIAATWPAWYTTRVARELGPCAAPAPSQARALLAHLLEAEISEQISYHRGAIRRFAALDIRARIMAWVLLGLTIGTAAIMFIQSFRHPERLSWSGLTSLALWAAPAIVTSLNAFRAELDLVRLTERSSRISRGLSRLMHAATARAEALAGTSDVTSDAARERELVALDRAVARGAASLMLGEVSQWRFVLETRAARLRRH